MSEQGPEFTPVAPASDNGNLLPVVEPESAQTSDAEQLQSDLNMTIGGPNYLPNRLNPARYAEEQAAAARMEARRQVTLVASGNGGELLPVAEAASVENATPKMTPEELTTYTEALNYDMTNPEDAKYNPEQLKNVEIMEGLQAKYPHAFIERITEDGRKYLVLKAIEITTNNPHAIDFRELDKDFRRGSNRFSSRDVYNTIALSYKGVTQIVQSRNRPIKCLDGFDLTPILDSDNYDYTTQKPSDKKEMYLQSNEKGAIAPQIFIIDNVGYEDIDTALLKYRLASTETICQERVETKKLTTDDILSAL